MLGRYSSVIAEVASECGGSPDVIEGIVTKSAPHPRNKVCPYYGSNQLQGTMAGCECVDALQREVARLRDHLREGTPSVSVVYERVSVRDMEERPWLGSVASADRSCSTLVALEPTWAATHIAAPICPRAAR